MSAMALLAAGAPARLIVDPGAAERVREVVAEAAAGEGWRDAFETAWPGLAPVFSASPYLATLARRRPARLAAILVETPETRLTSILAAMIDCAQVASEDAAPRMRDLKAELHLLTALADVVGHWDLCQVTSALTRFADEAVKTAVALAARDSLEGRGNRAVGRYAEAGPLPGLFFIAMGKMGAFELNYSSDIDISAFYELEAIPIASGIEPETFAVRFVERVASLLQRRTSDGYVVRVDLRLRPDPSSTPTAVTAAAALDYYESVGQNWERAAFIKARVAAGDIPRGEAFLGAVQPFIWRRNLDFAAIADIHSIKRQIHAYTVDERLEAKGADLKLGRGGIREIEFFIQTQQLILGGRHPSLRAPSSLGALAALAATGHVASDVADELAGAYRTLRNLEHRVQMIDDEQTHRLPEADTDRRRVAVLAGYGALRWSFDAAVGASFSRP